MTFDRGPLLDILNAMKGTDQELDLTVTGGNDPLEIRDVQDIQPLSGNVIRVTMRDAVLWLNADHVSAAHQLRIRN